MTGTRMFVAVLPPPDAVDHLEELLEVRRDAGAFRWTPSEQWHLTLAFAAAVPDRALDDVVERLHDAAGRRRPVRGRIAGGGAFPDPDRARVLYARLEQDDDAAEDLVRLAVGCRSALSAARAAPDGQRFRPHLTLARTGRPSSLTRWVRLLDAYRGPAWRADDVALVASSLGEGPRRRPRHEVVETFSLVGASA